jgi:regulator of replication initiation timing
MDIHARLDKLVKAVPVMGSGENYHHSVYLMDIESVRGKIVMMEEQIATLTKEVERLRAGGCARYQNTTQFCAEAVALQDEVKALRMKLDLTECHLKDANERLKERG